MHRRLAPWTVALVLAATALAGCGGDQPSGADQPSGSAEAPPTSAPATTGSTGSGGDDAETRQLFAQSCGSCHTFAAAGTDGRQGPNLDQVDDDVDEVRAKIENGGGGMPAFGTQLDAEQIRALADYVVENRP